MKTGMRVGSRGGRKEKGRRKKEGRKAGRQKKTPHLHTETISRE